MSIIVPSSHTRRGAWVNSKMYLVGGRTLLIVYCTISLMSCKDVAQTQNTQEARVTAQFITLHLGSGGCH